MDKSLLLILKCPICGSNRLSASTFLGADNGRIDEGVVWCSHCSNWYPIEGGVLEFLAGDLVYREDRERFSWKYSDKLTQLGLNSAVAPELGGDTHLQIKQQSHFDWYAHNSDQSYLEYEQSPFWVAADQMAFDTWRIAVGGGKLLLDLGCAQGRSTFKLMDLDIHIIGIDISKLLVRQAVERYTHDNYQASATFLVADATNLPFTDNSIDYVLIYGVLHHLPEPTHTCREVARVLKTGGIYFGSENNRTVFRGIFDFLQKYRPLWFEEAGPESLISPKNFKEAFSGTNMSIHTKTSIFCPPHFINHLKSKSAYRWLRFFDGIGQHIPFIKDHGGLILVRGEKGHQQDKSG